MVKFFLAHKLSADLTSPNNQKAIYLQLTFPHSIVFSILLLNAVITMISDEVFIVKIVSIVKKSGDNEPPFHLKRILVKPPAVELATSLW